MGSRPVDPEPVVRLRAEVHELVTAHGFGLSGPKSEWTGKHNIVSWVRRSWKDDEIRLGWRKSPTASYFLDAQWAVSRPQGGELLAAGINPGYMRRGLRWGAFPAVRTSGALVLALLQMGCGAGWRTTPLATGPFPRRQQAQVWTGGRLLQWHALVVASDSISGVPYTRPPACDSCRVAVPRGAVDSVRLGNPAADSGKASGLAWGSRLRQPW